jgi:hypothetical protein
MTHLTSVASSFEAKVIAARLGADGIVTELRGPVGGPYPFGEVEVLVEETELSVARELLALTAAERPNEADDGLAPLAGDAWYRSRWVPAAALLVLVASVVARVV